MRFFLLFLLCASQVSGEESRFSFFGGISGGYTRVQTDISTEADKNGYHFDIQGLGSYNWDPFVYDVGLGWLYNRASGSSGVIVEDTIKTYGGFLDISARYSWYKHWQTGFTSKTAFGTDFNFGGSLSKTNIAFFMGPQIAYEFEGGSFIYRFLLSGLTDLNIESRQVYLLLAGFQMGLPFGSREGESKSDEKLSAPIATVQNDISGFSVGSFELGSSETKQLQKIARVLLKYRSEWKSIFVGGHTDERGNESLNAKLSKDRALAAKRVLVKAGIPESLVTARGFSSREPKASGTGEDVWKQNRRVEIKLEGALKPEIALKIMKEIAE